eukprot:CAMPEP_0176233934 /NCGR_PEP_ID=MMETSP0121_2-20121125/26076_1 /TAXON_ID=160619 /ORGANISM="Kryptoperidinium foliaceum, Strain CCMP 1326" /LENGTH=368 /DNA_ID=CAMNT_0017573335 /DNA_START=57 /DNA_END=1164 /DNA_ORIENTATION=+
MALARLPSPMKICQDQLLTAVGSGEGTDHRVRGRLPMCSGSPRISDPMTVQMDSCTVPSGCILTQMRHSRASGSTEFWPAAADPEGSRPSSDPPPCRFFDSAALGAPCATQVAWIDVAQARPPEGAPPGDRPVLSVGSQGHASGSCRPCAFARSAAGCKFGAECQFCHEVADHPEAVRVRPCKGKRERFKRQMAAIERAIAEDPDLYDRGGLSLPALADRSDRARSRIMAQLQEAAAEARARAQSPATMAEWAALHPPTRKAVRGRPGYGEEAAATAHQGKEDGGAVARNRSRRVHFARGEGPRLAREGPLAELPAAPVRAACCAARRNSYLFGGLSRGATPSHAGMASAGSIGVPISASAVRRRAAE